MIAELTEEEKTELLQELLRAEPELVYDIRRKINARQGAGGPDDPIPGPIQVPDWCVCQRCRHMSREAANVCCGMQPGLCYSQMPVSFKTQM